MRSTGFLLVVVLVANLLLVSLADPPEWKVVNTVGVPKRREEACFVMVDEKAYLIGGRGLNPVSVYNPQTRKWVNKTRSPLELHHMQCVAIGTNVYIVSAYTGGYPREKVVPNVWVYDTVTDGWQNKTGLPASRRRGSSASVAVGNDIYVSHGSYGGHGIYGKAVAWLDKYNVVTDTWTTGLADAMYARDHTGGGLVNGKICVAAGRQTGMVDFYNATVLQTECYDVATNSWSVHANITQGRAGSAYGTTCDGKLMVAGGEGFGVAWSNVDVFDGNAWNSFPSLNQARHGTGLAVSCSCRQIHIASGSYEQGGSLTLNSTETLFPDGIDKICSPSLAPSAAPSRTPSIVPSVIPSLAPSSAPSDMPSQTPSSTPSVSPSNIPSAIPSSLPSAIPSSLPSAIPSSPPSAAPSRVPSVAPTEAFKVVAITTSPSFTYARINSGGSLYNDTRGRAWQEDKYFKGGKAVVAKTQISIAGTEDDELYRSQRRGDVTYKIPLAAGRYNVTLHFAEFSVRTPGTRLFDVQIENILVLSNFDIYATYGFRSACTFSKTLSVIDGYLDVQLLGGDGIISGIEVSLAL